MVAAVAFTVVVVSGLAFRSFQLWLELQERRRMDSRLEHEVLAEVRALRERIDLAESRLAKIVTQLSSVQGGFAAARTFRGLRGSGG